MNPLSQDLKSTDSLPDTLLEYQKSWVKDDSQLKIGEKSRRIGLTWAEASDDVLIASSKKSAGGSNVYYIGYNQDMAIEFIEACAGWAKAFNAAASEIEQGILADEEKDIKTYTIKFPRSGHRIVALSSRPANLRGKQGVVVIDEAAFHDSLPELLKAAMALLIWGGRVRVITTHDGDGNPFNDLVQEVRAGKRKGTVHRITFKEAVNQGLYRRVCLRRGIEWSQARQDEWVQSVYDFYGDDAKEELDVIPSQGTGSWLTRALIEARMDERPVLRWTQTDEFALWPPHQREAEALAWLESAVKPLLDQLPAERWKVIGQDFARTAHLSIIWPLVISSNLKSNTPFLIELKNIPYDQQRQILFYLIDAMRKKLRAVVIDKTGNGGYLAETALQSYGEVVHGISLSEAYYRENAPKLKAAFEDAQIIIPKNDDVMDDFRAVKKVNGVPKVPASTGQKGRHGDGYPALLLAHYGTQQDPTEIEFTALPRGHEVESERDHDLDDDLNLGKAGIW
jgi:phage FluMu gp28-like protein